MTSIVPAMAARPGTVGGPGAAAPASSSMTGATTGGRGPSLAQPGPKPSRILATIALVLVGVAFIIPLVWIVVSAFSGSATVSLAFPESWTLDNFSAVMTVDQTWRPLWNSLVLSMGAAVLTVVCGALAAYPLSRYQMRFKRSFMYTVLFGTCLPITAMMVPVYALFVSLNLLDSAPGLIAFMSATSLPMAIWMLKNFMDGVPIELEEAAWTDGAGSMRTLWSIVLPLMRPGLLVVFIFVFTQAWGNFFVPFVLTFDSAKQPAAVAIYNFFGTYGAIAYGKLAAFAILYSVPVLVLYTLSQKLSGSSFALAGAVKG